MTTKEQNAQELFDTAAAQIKGLAFRNFNAESDFELMAELFNRSNIADQIREATSAENIIHRYKHKKEVNPYKDFFFAEVDGQAIAYGYVFWEDEHEGPRIYFHSGHVLPEWRRKGLGRAMMARNVARLKAIAADHPAEKQKMLHGWAADTEIAKNALFREHGYQAIRYFYLMLRDLSAEIGAAQIPEGLEMRPVDESHFRPIFAASNEAFRDHWGHIEQTEEDYKSWISHPTRDETLWKVAWDGDQVAGMVLNGVDPEENKKLGVNWAWTDPISVRRPWRKRGLARALILESLVMLKAKGFDYAALGVDTQNPSGALGLYESCGYKTEEHWTDYRKAME